MQVPTPAPRARSRWRFPAAVLGGILLLGLGLRTETVARFAARVLETLVERATGEDVTIAAVNLSYAPPEVTIVGAVITHRATGDTIVSLDTLTATAGHEGLRPVLRRVTVNRPRVELHLDEEGLREFRDLAGGSGGNAPERFPWEELAIVDGVFSLGAPGARVLARDVNLTPREGRHDLTIGAITLEAGAISQTSAPARFASMEITPSHVDLPDFDLVFPALRLDGAAFLSTAAPLRGDLSLHLDLGRLTGTDGVTPWTDGRVDLDVELAGTAATPDLQGAISVLGLTLWQRIGTGLAPTRFGDLVGGLVLDLTGSAALVIRGGRMDWGEGIINLDARVGLEDRSVTGTVVAENVSLQRILQSVNVAPTPWVDFRADVETQVAGTWNPVRLDGPFEIALTHLEVGDAPIDAPHATLLAIPRGTLEGDLIITATNLVLDVDRVRTGRSHGRAYADIGFAPQGPLVLEVALPVLDLSTLAPLGDLGLAGMGTLQGTLSGPYNQLSASGRLTADGAVVLGFPLADHLDARFGSDIQRLWFTDIHASLGDTHYDGAYAIDFSRGNHMDTQIRVTDGRIADLAGVFVDLAGADGAVTGNLSLTGTPYDLSGDASFTLADIDLYGERFPHGRAVGWMDNGEFTLGELSFQRGDELVVARGSVKRGFLLNLEILSDGLHLERLDHLVPLALPATGSVAIDARVSGTLFDWLPAGRISASDVRYLGQPLADSQITFDSAAGVISWDGRFFGTAGIASGTLGMYGDQPYRLDATLAAFPLQFFYPQGADGTPVMASLTGTLGLAGHFGETPIPAEVTADIGAGGVTAQWDNHTLTNPGPWHIEVRERKFDIPGLVLAEGDNPRDPGTTRLRLGGHGQWAGPGAPGRLSFRVDGHADAELARMFVPGLLDARGRLDLDLAYDSTASEPARIHAGADLVDVTVQTLYFPEAFEGLEARLDATPEGYIIRDLAGSVGGGRIESALSTIAADNWWPQSYALEATLTDARVQYLDYLPPIVGDGTLTFDGPVGQLLLGGNIRIRDMEFRERIDWEAMVLSLTEETLTAAAPIESENYFSMDLHVTADRTVRLRNNVADADASADVHIVGDTARPGLTGEIRVVPGGTMYLHEREFDIARAEIRYVDPYTFDPDLDILLETDVRSRDETYQVDYAVTGPFSDWRSTTTSEPALSQADVNALLLFGYTRDDLEQYGGIEAALVAETGDLLFAQTPFLARSTLVNTLVDRWSLVSGASERGSATVSSELRLVAEKQWNDTDFTFETTVSGGFGRDWYVSLERRIVEAMYATAYVATQQEGRSLPIGAAYGTEFKFRWEWN